MTILQGYDGELRLIEYGISGTTYHLEILFCDMNFRGPIARPLPGEELILDRGRWDDEARHIEGSDLNRFGPINFSFNCRLADTVNTQILVDWLSGVTNISGTTQLYSFKGKTSIGGVTCPPFGSTTDKYAYRAEILWDGSTDLGFRYDEVWFRPQAQSLMESPNQLTLNCQGLIYGDVSRISTFTTGTVSIV